MLRGEPVHVFQSKAFTTHPGLCECLSMTAPHPCNTYEMVINHHCISYESGMQEKLLCIFIKYCIQFKKCITESFDYLWLGYHHLRLTNNQIFGMHFLYKYYSSIILLRTRSFLFWQFFRFRHVLLRG